jgi:hypothetical protein
MSATCYEDHVGSTLGESRPEVATNAAGPHDCSSHKTLYHVACTRQHLAGGEASEERFPVAGSELNGENVR